MIDEGAGDALHGVAAGLAAPLARGEVGIDVLARQPLEAHARLDQAPAELAGGADQDDAGVDPVGAAGEQAQTGGGVLDGLRLAEDAAADADHGIGGDDQRAGKLGLAFRERDRGGRLLVRQPLGEVARRLALLRRLVDGDRHHPVGLDADLGEQRQAPRRA